MISDQHKAIIIHIPKTGGTSIEKALNMKIIKGRHLTVGNSKKVYGDGKYDKYFTFSFVRNPWDRMASIYSYYKFGAESQNNKIKSSLRDVDFEEFVMNFEKYYWTNELRISQKEWLTDANGNLDVDFIGRYENYLGDVQKILAELNVKTSIGHARKSKRSDYRDYYNENTMNIVANLWADDIEYFKYEF